MTTVVLVINVCDCVLSVSEPYVCRFPPCMQSVQKSSSGDEIPERDK